MSPFVIDINLRHIKIKCLKIAQISIQILTFWDVLYSSLLRFAMVIGNPRLIKSQS